MGSNARRGPGDFIPGTLVRWIRVKVRKSHGEVDVSLLDSSGSMPLSRFRLFRSPLNNSRFVHDRDVSIGLVCDHVPATGEARENRRLCSTLRQKHQTMTFLSPGAATARFLDFSIAIKRGQ
jgi:hypothetical protein